MTAHRYAVTANLFAIPLGLCGLAQCWTLGADLGAPGWPADVGWLLAAAVWLVVAGAWGVRNRRPADLARALADPILGPFSSLATIVPMVLGAALARHAPTPGRVVFIVALVLTLLAGGWLSGQWILSDTTLAQWHPGYFLPTVAGGFVAAAVAAGFGWISLAKALFGYGTVCWLVLGSIILARLFTGPALPAPLRATVAIELAPPAVGGIAWFAINGGRPDSVALFLAGYAVLMAMVQVRMIPLYRTVPFGPAWWSFSFPIAAAVAYAVHWLAAERVDGLRAYTWALLAVTTAGAGLLVGRTVVALVRRRFLPLAPVAPTTAAVPTAAARASVIGSTEAAVTRTAR